MFQILPEEVLKYLYLVMYLTTLIIILSIIYGLIEWLSRDRVLKIFDGKKVVVFTGSEAIYGRLSIPSKGGGSFEVFFLGDRLESPETLLAFLVENYHETGDEKFLREAEALLKKLKKLGRIRDDYDLNKVVINPWAPPSLTSKKIFSSDLNNVYAILMFKYMMDEKEMRRKWRELKDIYHPSLIFKLKRTSYNIFAYIRDKIASISGQITSPLLSYLTPELQKTFKEAQVKALTQLGANYNPLLENSIGRLITVLVDDVDGEKKYYQGVLKEYSSNYIAVYDVDYRFQMKTMFKGTNEVENYPQTILTLHGFTLPKEHHIKIEFTSIEENKMNIRLINIYNGPIRIEKIVFKDKEIDINKVLFPKEHTDVIIEIKEIEPEPLLTIFYEISKEADIIWPISKVKIVGAGDYPATLLSEILKD